MNGEGPGGFGEGALTQGARVLVPAWNSNTGDSFEGEMLNEQMLSIFQPSNQPTKQKIIQPISTTTNRSTNQSLGVTPPLQLSHLSVCRLPPRFSPPPNAAPESNRISSSSSTTTATASVTPPVPGRATAFQQVAKPIVVKLYIAHAHNEDSVLLEGCGNARIG